MDLCPFGCFAIKKIGRNLEEKICHRARNSAVSLFAPANRLFVVIDGHYKVDQTFLHPLDVLTTWDRKSFCRAELRMGMKVSDNLQPVEPFENRLYLLMVFVMHDNAFVFPVGGLKAKRVLDNEPVFQSVA